MDFDILALLGSPATVFLPAQKVTLGSGLACEACAAGPFQRESKNHDIAWGNGFGSVLRKFGSDGKSKL